MAETGQKPGRGQLYLATHRNEDGSYVNEAAKEICLSIKFLAGGRKDEAMSFLRLALAKDPEYVRALLIGQSLLQDGSLPEATEYLERAIAKKRFQWDTTIEGAIKDKFMSKCAERYEGILSEARACEKKRKLIPVSIWESWKPPKCQGEQGICGPEI